MPTEKTKAEYRRLAAHFYEKRLDGVPSPKQITDALKECAGEYRPAYWRRLRCALALDQREKGYKAAAERIEGTLNPLTTDLRGEAYDKDLRGAVPPKQRRAKSITVADRERLYGALGAATGQEMRETLFAVMLADTLGVRPAEMLHLRVDLERGEVHVKGVKKTKQRGADRVLRVPKGLGYIVAAAQEIQRAESDRPGVIHRVQSRLDRLTRQLWPRRRARPTLYTFRHQTGAMLKASGASRAAIAYVMGHQSTQSVEVYGDRRSAKRSGGLAVQAGDREAQAFVGRQNHREPHAVPAEWPAYRPETPTPVQQEGGEPPPSAPSNGPGM